MRSKRRHKSIYQLKYQDSIKHVCSKCNKSIYFENLKQNHKKSYYRALCKSAKCLIHKKITKFENCVKAKPIESRLLQKIASGGKCRIKEFEDQEKSQIRINPSMLNFIEGLMEKVSLEDTKFENILAETYVKEAISKTVIWPLNKPKIFKGLRAAPKGVLLFGPSGVGKNIMGKHIAFQTNASFFNLPALELKALWSDNKKDFVKALFLVAKARQPSIIFIDDVDILFSQKALYESKSNINLKNELFLCMDSTERNPKDRILVIAATKKPFDLDNEIIMRFSKKFFVSLPDKAARKRLLEKLLESECHSLEYCDIEELSHKTEGYTVEEIKQMSKEAAMSSMMSLPVKEFVNLELAVIKPISVEDFITALRMVKPSVPKESLKIYENWDIEYGFGGQYARKINEYLPEIGAARPLNEGPGVLHKFIISDMAIWNATRSNKYIDSSYVV